MRDLAKGNARAAELVGDLANMSKEAIYRVAGKRVGMDGKEVKKIYLRYLRQGE